MPVKTNVKNSNLYSTYSIPNNYKVLTNTDNKKLDLLYKNWTIKLDRYTDKINISLFTRQELIPYNSYFDPNFQSAWENKVYNLHLPPDFSKFKSISYTDIANGLYLSSGDKLLKTKVSQETENNYINALKSLNTFKNLDDSTKNINLDWLIKYERLLIPDLIKQSNDNDWSLGTFACKFKAISRFLKLMLGELHELKIKYSMLYVSLDYIIKLEKGANSSGGDDIMPFDDLLIIVDYLEKSFTKYLDDNLNIKNASKINSAWKANLDFLSVAVMVWDYPSRSDKYDTVIIKNPNEAIKNTTYLVCDDSNPPYWIYRKNVKDIGRPLVIVKLEKEGLNGLQSRLIDAISLSLKLFPRNYLFASKSIDWKKSPDVNVIKKASNVSGWIRNIKSLSAIHTQFPNISLKTLGINLFRRSFVTHFSDLMNNNEKRKMVHAMLTSFAKINTYYKRNFDTDKNNNKIIINNHHNVINVPDDVNEVIDEPIEEPVIEPVIEPVNEPEIEPEIEPVNESEIESVDESVDESVNEPVDEPVDEPVNESVVNTEPPKIPMTNAERQRIWYANNKLKEDYKKARKKIENTDERKARRYVRELNQGRKSIDDITRNTIAKYQISFVNGTYISGIL